ncbi:MAG: class II aldolase/adducin family protein [Myxococcota bacterium]
MSEKLRNRLLATARALNTTGLSVAMSGNTSVRTEAGFLITPTGAAYSSLAVNDLVEVAPGGQVLSGGTPSSEWRFHDAVYQHRADANAIVHTHSTYATALACLRKPIPAFHYMVAAAGGHDIRCAPYALYGTQELSDHVLAGLEDRKVTLLANHGLVALGKDLDEALRLAEEVEQLARHYCAALAIGEPILLSREQMDEALAKYANYGTPGAPAQ